MKAGTYVILTAEIWQLEDISPAERVLLAYIAGFCRNGGKCIQSNASLGEVMGKDPRTIRRQISHLIERGHLVALRTSQGRQLRTEVSSPPDRSVLLPRTKVTGKGDESVHHIVKDKKLDIDKKEGRPSQREAVAAMLWQVQTDPDLAKVPKEALPTIAKECLDYYAAREDRTKSGKIRNWTPVLTRWLRNAAQRIPSRPKPQPRDAAADFRWYEKRGRYWRKRIAEAEPDDPRVEDWRKEAADCENIAERLRNA